jgi:hypothetical protein
MSEPIASPIPSHHYSLLTTHSHSSSFFSAPHSPFQIHSLCRTSRQHLFAGSTRRRHTADTAEMSRPAKRTSSTSHPHATQARASMSAVADAKKAKHRGERAPPLGDPINMNSQSAPSVVHDMIWRLTLVPVDGQPLRRGDACLMCRAKKLVSVRTSWF